MSLSSVAREVFYVYVPAGIVSDIKCFYPGSVQVVSLGAEFGC